MTRAELLGHLTAILGASLDGAYPSLRVTTAMEDAVNAYSQGVPWVLITLKSHSPNRWQGEDNWEFLLQGSVSLQPGAQPDTTTANDADLALWDAIDEALNGDEGHATLAGIGILVHEDMDGMPEDQQSETYINPHVFTCSTY